MGCVTKQKYYLKTTESPGKQSTNNSDMVDEGEFYKVFIVDLTTESNIIHNLEMEKSKQIRIQFLYREKEQLDVDKFLVLIHHECK